jgi:TolB protein
MPPKTLLVPAVLLVGTMAAVAWQQGAQQPPPQKPTPPGQEPLITIMGGPGSVPHYAVPDFLPLTNDAETVAAAKVVGQVLWDDLRFEREFDMIPRDTYTTIPVARSIADVPFDQWRELGADGLIIGTVQRNATGMHVEMRLYQAQTGRVAFARQYDQTADRGRPVNVRLFAHTIADEVLQQQVGLRGVARTRIAFDTDRDNERMSGTVEKRQVKEIYICDYDGEYQTRVTINKNLNIAPNWAPDGRSITYTSYAPGNAAIFVSFIYQGLLRTPAGTSPQVMNYLPVYSPDGSKIAFVSNRDGNDEIYVMKSDGSDVRRLTRNQAIDVTPTWSPNGQQIAFVSDRSGAPQIYVMSAEGGDATQLTRESYCDRPTWSPAPFNEIAFASRTSPGIFDIKVLDLATNQIRQLTFGQGTSESPAFAPNGKHLAFASTRAGGGRFQIWTIGRDGRDARQVTKAGNNFMPNWSR